MGMFNTQLPLLNGKNYDYWAIVMRALFTSQDLQQFVEDGFEEPADKNEFNSLTQAEKDQLKSDKKEDAKALFFLFQSVHESIFPRIAAATTSKEAWETLKTAYQGMEKVKTVKPQFIEEEAYDESLEKTVNDKNCLSRDEDDEEMAEMHPQTAAPTQGQQVAPLRRIECASPSTPQEATNEGTNSLFALSSHVDDSVHFKNAVEDRKWTKPMNGRKELKFLEDLFKEYGVRYVTLAKMAKMGFTANTLVNMTEEEIEDLMMTLIELYQMDLPIGKRFETTSAMRAEKEQVADILTKPLDQKSFEFLMKCLGMTSSPAVELPS